MSAKPGIARSPAFTPDAPNSPRRFFGVFRYSKRALELVWATSKKLSILFAVVTIIAGALPSLVAWISARILNSAIAAGKAHAAGLPLDLSTVIYWVLA